MCEEMNSDFDNLLYYTQIRWLSKGKVVKRVYSLNDDIIICLREQNMIELEMQWEEHSSSWDFHILLTRSMYLIHRTLLYKVIFIYI